MHPPPALKMAQHMIRPNIILLKDGTDTSQGKPQIISNINGRTRVSEQESGSIVQSSNHSTWHSNCLIPFSSENE